MSQIHVTHIRNAVLSRFEQAIDLSDINTASAEQHEKAKLTRCLAAFCIAEQSGLDDVEAAACVTDGTGDNGIDALYYDSTEKTCWVVQSKWKSSGNGSIDLGDMLKFLKGFRDLTEAQFDRFNEKVRRQQTAVFGALSDANAKFCLVLAYTGEQPISAEVHSPLTCLLSEMNSPTEVVSSAIFDQAKLHGLVAKGVIGDSVNLEIMLRQWGMLQEPYLSYYGQVAVSDVMSWGRSGASLTARNLRQFRGSTEVNEAISKTLVNYPQHFWYFNNGLTIICESLKKKMLGGNHNDTGTFECIGASVVNGAQTVGTIVELGRRGELKDARVLVRLISLEDCPDGFGDELTRAANTQNRIEKRDFAAQDPNQKRLRTELMLENQKEYAYQAGERAPQGDQGCTLDEAAVAMACRLSDVSFAVQVKRELGVIYDDLSKPPYTLIFNDKTTGPYLWESVLLMRGVEGELRRQQEQRSGKEQLILIHGNRFLLHIVSQQLKTETRNSVEPQRLETLTTSALDATITEVADSFSSAYPANLFKNASKCRDLKNVVLSEIQPPKSLSPQSIND